MLIDKRIDRLVKLIYKLSTEEFIQRKTLPDELSCSLRTVDAALYELKNEMERKHTDMTIEYVDSETMYLKGKDDAFLKQLLHQYYIQDDMVCFFLSVISKNTSAKTFVEEQYISRATFFRKLKLFKKWLERFQLSFDLRSLKIHGDERQIRHFYFSLLIEITGKLMWPFSFQKTMIEKRVEQIIETLSLRLSPVQKEAYIYHLAIQHYRIENGFYSPGYDIPFPANIKEKLMSECHLILNGIPEEYRKGEEDFLLMMIVNSPSHYHPLEIVRQNIEIHQKTQTEAWLFTVMFTEKLGALFPSALNKENMNHIKGHLIQLYCYYEHHATNFLHYKDMIYANAITKQHPLLSSIVHQLADETENNGFKRSPTAHTRYLLMLYTFVDIDKLQPALKLLILSREGPIYEETLAEKIISYVPFQLEISTSTIQNKNVSEEGYSLILTDMPFVRGSTDNILYMHSPPTDGDWRRIYDRCASAYWYRLNANKQLPSVMTRR